MSICVFLFHSFRNSEGNYMEVNNSLFQKYNSSTQDRKP